MRPCRSCSSNSQETDARVYLLHVVSLLEYGDEEKFLKQLFCDACLKRMQEMVNQPFFEGVNVVEVITIDTCMNVNKLAIKMRRSDRDGFSRCEWH